MELRQLEYFVAVVEEANFTRAAERLHVSQSGVSAQIRQLERELGQSLLDRSERVVRLTAAGAAILPLVKAALAAVAATRATADELTGLVRGRLAVGMVTACTIVTLFDVLADFHERYPGIEIALNEDSSDRLVEGVRSGRFDVALLGTAVDLPAGIESQMVADERLVAAVPLGNALDGQQSIALASLANYPLVTLPSGAGVRAAFDTACTAAGVQVRVAFEASAPDTVAGLSERGLGVAILSETMASARRETLHAIEIIDPPVRSRLELAWPAGGASGPAAKAFVQSAREAFRVAG